ncbi:MAG: GTP 3',8-cyclase MoaA [Chloroflexi bacterium]|nr:GTP 3',8-cyclase MoaA [Chloroflexota bacterium]
MSDSFQRPVNYLRISVTDRCNLRCSYCMPKEGIPLVPHTDILTYEEIGLVVRAAVRLGIDKIRISGGEPLVRYELVYLAHMLAQIEGVNDLSMTTNGTLLSHHAASLKAAGLGRVNVSLDSLRRERFHQITGYDRLFDVLEGIAEARRVELEPVKINVVVMRGVNDDEVLDFALRSKEGWHVRFIELMPLVNRGTKPPEFVSATEMWRRLAPLGGLEACPPPVGNGPAKYYRLPGAAGTVGFITPVSEHFCFKCNRLRLTADGKLLPCLLSEREVDLRPALRAGASEEEIECLVREAIMSKPEGHKIARGQVPQNRLMNQVGG